MIEQYTSLIEMLSISSILRERHIFLIGSGLWEDLYKSLTLGSSIQQPALMFVWGHCPVGPSSEVILLLYYCIHFVHCMRSTGSKTVTEHDATTTMSNSWYSVLGVKSLPLTPSNISPANVDKQFNFYLLKFMWSAPHFSQSLKVSISVYGNVNPTWL